MKKRFKQADRANDAQVELHIQRQKELGERAIDDRDEPTQWEFLATFAIVGMVLFGTFQGWW